MSIGQAFLEKLVDAKHRREDQSNEIERLQNILRLIANGLHGQYATREGMRELAESGLPEGARAIEGEE